jgi:hypothetical protein
MEKCIILDHWYSRGLIKALLNSGHITYDKDIVKDNIHLKYYVERIKNNRFTTDALRYLLLYDKIYLQENELSYPFNCECLRQEGFIEFLPLTKSLND